jgi:3-oxoadipate enol-lactonase
MPTAAVNDIEVSYADSGGSGPVVLLSHGFLMDHTMFGPQLAALAPEYRVITWDERGFGATDASGPFSYWDSASDALRLLDHLGVDRAVFGGMSQGGFLSLRAALLAPQRVRALILLDTQAGQEDPALLAGYERMAEIWLERGPAPVQDIVADIILGSAERASWLAKWAAHDTGQFWLAFRCLIDRDDLTSRLAEISCPALVVHGTADAAIPMARAEALRDGLGGPADLVPIEGGSHAASLTHPDQVNAAILAFLHGLGRGPRDRVGLR